MRHTLTTLTRLLGLTALCPLAFVAPAAGQCPAPDNLLSNCGFEQNVDGWRRHNGAPLIRTTADSHSGIGALEIAAHYNDITEEHIFQLFTVPFCLDIEPSAGYVAGVFMKTLTSDDGSPVDCHVRADNWTSCPTPLGDYLDSAVSPIIPVDTSLWQRPSVDFTTPPGTGGVRLVFRCENQDIDFSTLLDDAFLIQTAFFTDGFESGDTAAWSTDVP